MSTPQTLEYETQQQPEVAPAAPALDNSTNVDAARLAVAEVYATLAVANPQPIQTSEPDAPKL